jgi:uncharacterized protein (TIGR00297 family)
MDYLTLDVNGVILAFVLAFIMLFVATFSEPTIVMGWVLGLFYVITMLFFLAISAVVTRLGERYKLSIKQYQKTRGIKNVMANGFGPLIFVVLIFFIVNSQYSSLAFMAGFIASVAAVTSDKFSSEVGVLDGTPVSIVTSKKVRKGESGGVTLLGLSAGLFGAFIVALVMGYIYLLLLPPVYNCPMNGCGSTMNIVAFAFIAAITLGGFIGTIVDSIFGHFEEKGIGNKYTTNFICSIFGGIFGILIYFLIFNALIA